MSLQEKLNQIKKAFESQAPEQAKAIIHRATEDLRASGILNRIPRVGDEFSHFVRPDHNGNELSTEKGLNHGPLLLSFYRGKW